MTTKISRRLALATPLAALAPAPVATSVEAGALQTYPAYFLIQDAMARAQLELAQNYAFRLRVTKVDAARGIIEVE